MTQKPAPPRGRLATDQPSGRIAGRSKPFEMRKKTLVAANSAKADHNRTDEPELGSVAYEAPPGKSKLMVWFNG